MGDYGTAIYDAGGVERLRFADPLIAIYAFTVSDSGSITVPGVYAHAHVTTSPAVAILAPGYHCHAYSVGIDDVITWYADSYTITSTIIFVNFCK